MIDVKEAIAVLKQFKEESQKHKDSYTPIGSNLSPVLKIMQDTYQENIDTFEMAIKSLERTRWIPVSERLPTKKDADRLGRVLSYNSYMDWVDTFSWHGVEHSDSVTHWIPLPAPPEMTREEAGHWDGIAPDEHE